MFERRYKVGDKVKIVQYNPDRIYKFGFVEEMQVFCGRIMTIRAIYDEDEPAGAVDYRLEGDPGNYMWSISMFEVLPPDELFIDLDLIM